MSASTMKTKGEKGFDVFNVILMCLLIILFLYPILNVLAISLSSSFPVQRGEVTFYPIHITGKAYHNIFNNQHIWRSYANTIYVAAAGCVLGMIFSTAAAYPLAFGDFYGKKLYAFMILFTMWFGGGMIPSYLVMRNLKLLDTHWALIFSSLAPAYYIIILRSFFQSIPISLIESAKLDGANDVVCMTRIVIPVSKPVLATVALWFIVGHWNSFLPPLMYLNDTDKYTLQVVLHDIVLQASGKLYEVEAAVHAGEGSMVIPQQVQNAVIFVSLIPMLMIYPFLQRYFVKGILIGSVKA